MNNGASCGERGIEYHSEFRYRGYTITVYKMRLPIGWAPSGWRRGYVSVVDDSLNPDADLEGAPRHSAVETIANAKELIESHVEGEIEDVEDSTPSIKP